MQGPERQIYLPFSLDCQLHGQGSPLRLELISEQPSHAPAQILGMQGNWQPSPYLQDRRRVS
jgi:hypothetical protein